jgi:4-diphosphocytidyl-2-C-methyl-D-erythritol kinase
MTVYTSPCKINIGLEVLSVRDDGYHNINTLFYRIDSPNDTIEVSSSDDLFLTTNSDILPVDENNLILRTLEKCAAALDQPQPKLGIHLEKRLPVGAGIGGGSGNAATALQIYSELVSPLSQDLRMSIAKSIGADVAFLSSSFPAAVGTGIGDVLTPIEMKITDTILLVKPSDISISTAEAYSNLIIKERPLPTDLAAAAAKPLTEWKSIITNDFEEYAFSEYPALAEIKEMLYESGAAFALMSGSGSLIYGIFPKLRNAQAAVLDIKSYYPDAFIAAHLP